MITGSSVHNYVYNRILFGCCLNCLARFSYIFSDSHRDVP